MKGLQGKTAIVTGGSSGIGQAIAIRLGEEGVNVAINYVGGPRAPKKGRKRLSTAFRCASRPARNPPADPSW
jgi:glucose 1-dehydrogenase